MYEDFFDLILPREGYRCVASETNGKWRHAYHPENGGAAEQVRAREVLGQSNVFFGCASYEEPSGGRKGQNVQAVRSFWLDLDTNEFKIRGDAAYTGRQDALEGLAVFCCELGIRDVTVVSSGFGVHAYWSMDCDISPIQWSETAHLLKHACDKWGLKVDHSRTTDIASLMRVPGTTNRKDPENHQPAKLLNLGKPVSLSDFRQKIGAYVVGANLPSSAQVISHEIGNNTQLIATYPPSDAYLIAESCAVIRHIRDTAGHVSEPLWFAGLGLLVHTEQSDDICHEWSEGHPEYDFAKTQAKIEHARAFPPTLCERFEALSDGLCHGCPFKDGA